ncbi:hypothetical protein [Agreia pratensis]|uniref:Cro/C1-type HTH DNA-binding domain-containing protein n=1 Tax=Agreia pratensis TaxID=150121 RepID=A0A1X7K2Q2_9MICO|nr:hypothetical protein [Agreia pratensis]SMG34964.1 hypothetical protein SAMN06296010_2010 [Agreia pratensis]
MNNIDSTDTITIHGRDKVATFEGNLTPHQYLSREIREIAGRQNISPKLLARLTNTKRKDLEASLSGDRDWLIAELFSISRVLNLQASDLVAVFDHGKKKVAAAA